MPNHFRLKALVVAMGLAAGTTAFAASTPPATAGTTVIKAATRMRATDTVVGPMALTQSMRVTLSLYWRNEAQLKEFIAQPHHQNLTQAEFNARYAPSVSQVAQVKAFLQAQGFTDLRVSPDSLLVSGLAPVSKVQAAFHTTLVNVRTAKGRIAFANSVPAAIPVGLHGVVHEVIGLQDVHRFHTAPLTKITRAATTAAFTPPQFAPIYNASSLPAAISISVGVMTAGSMGNVESDFQSFLQQNGYGNIPLNVVPVDGGGSGTSGDVEWDLDTQDIVGMSGGVAAIYLYDAPSLSTQGMLDAFSAGLTGGQVKVMNVSIQGCETSSETNGAATGDNIFQEADAEGFTFSIASGDHGSDACQNGGNVPSWPAVSQYVLAVGGTTLSGGGSSYGGETAWSGSGGGVSTYEAMPSWQQGVGANAGHSTRGVPDIAFDADPNTGATIIADGQEETVGGTSLASPLFVGAWARAMQSDGSLGFAAPIIYADAAAHYSSDFHDVAAGSNGSYSAAPGWDYATGFGSLNVANFVAGIAGGSAPPPPPGQPPPPPPPGGTCTAWVDGGSYTAGEVVSYQGQNYTAIVTQTDWAGAGWNPASTPSLWAPGGTCN